MLFTSLNSGVSEPGGTAAIDLIADYSINNVVLVLAICIHYIV
jgi:hypothetical protein